jgi:hypothetical protein
VKSSWSWKGSFGMTETSSLRVKRRETATCTSQSQNRLRILPKKIWDKFLN